MFFFLLRPFCLKTWSRLKCQTFLWEINQLLDKKARFACVRAALGWSALYHGSCIDPTNQSHILVLPPDLPFPITQITIQLLIKDVRLGHVWDLKFFGYGLKFKTWFRRSVSDQFKASLKLRTNLKPG